MTLADRLRAVFTPGATGDVELIQGDSHSGEMGDESFAAAAVLVPVVDRPEPGLLLTTRTGSLRRHAGQVAFPGGRIDPEDAGPIEAALREAREEIGLSPDLVDVIGVADRYRTGSGYEVTPVIGLIPPDLPLVPQAAEVDDWFEVPLAFLLEPANHIEQAIEWQGRLRHYYEINWNGRRIWGVTAGMIVNLGRRLNYG